MWREFERILRFLLMQSKEEQRILHCKILIKVAENTLVMF